MLKFNFQRIFSVKAIDKSFTYLLGLGFSRSTASRINAGSMKSMKLKDLEKFCEKFDCTPNDLLEWIPNKYVENPDKHPLTSLRRAESSVNIKALLHSIPVAHLEEIEKFIQEKAQKKPNI
jgi:DNA-binding Xre family transcriptional regulator